MPGRLTLALLFATALFGQKYNGPQPEKPDLPYLVHADNLVATEAGEAKQETRKNDILYVIDGATSPADRKSTRLNSSHGYISYAVFCLKKKKKTTVLHKESSSFTYD